MNAIRTLHEFVESEYPTCVGLLLFGSQATGRATADSDVDACVLVPHVIRPYQLYRETRRASLDLHIYDFAGLSQAMRGQQRNHVAHVAGWLRSGIILEDKCGLLDRARKVALQILETPVKIDDWSTHRTSIAHLLRHVRTTSDEHKKMSCLNALYRLTTNVMLLRAGRWLQSPTELANELGRIDAVRSAQLHEAYGEAVRGTPTGFLSLIESELDAIGGTIRDAEKRFVA